MNLIDKFKNNTIFSNKYKTDSEAVIISCFFNPQKSDYRIKAFNIWYDSIKHMDHRIIECVMDDNEPQLESNKHIKVVRTSTCLWHKESLLNMIIKDLPEKYKYVFWIDADVIFTNKNWLVDGVRELRTNNIIQPFEYCIHLDKDELEPSFELPIPPSVLPNRRNSKVWRSFCSNFADDILWKHTDYNDHGHVGFAWGAKRDILDKIPLYDRALIGGADHIMAHAAAGQINHSCITKAYRNDLQGIANWSHRFSLAISHKIGYVKGDLYHIWHGDLDKREYLKRIQEFDDISEHINVKDANGLYTIEDDSYVRNYFAFREEINGVDIATNNHNEKSTMEFGGGHFGGGGSESDWNNETFS